jgi:putative ABC transport system permease protein
MLSRLRWNKVLRDAWRHKARSVLVVLAIAVGVATFGMLLTARQAAQTNMVEGYWRNVPPSMILYAESFRAELLDLVGDMPEVGQVEARKIVYGRVRAADSDQWVTLQLSVLQDYADSRISVVRSESGAWPPGRHEMNLERSTVAVFGLDVGDTVVVETPGGVQKELQVAGTVHEFNFISSFIAQVARGFVDWDTMAWLGEDVSYNALYVTVAGDQTDPAHVEAVQNAVVERLERSGCHVTGADPEITIAGKHWAHNYFSALMLVLGVVGTLTLLLSGFLVMNTTMALLAQETRQIGVMKTVGGKRGQIVTIYLSTVVLYGGLALAIAVPLGLLSGRGFADIGSFIMNYDIDSYGLVPWVLALQVGMAIGVPALAALVPILIATRKTVREAIGDYGIGDGRAGLIDRLMARMRGLPQPLMFGLRNTFRRKARLVLTLAALSLAGAIFVGVFSTRDSMLGLVHDSFSLFNYDVEIYFEGPVRPRVIEAAAEGVPGVTCTESWLYLTGTHVGPGDRLGMSFPILGAPLGQQTAEPVLVEGRWLLPEDEQAIVVSTSVLQQIPGLSVGEELTFEIAGRRSSWRVVGVLLSTGNLGYANGAPLAEAAGMAGRANRAAFKLASGDDPAVQQAAAEALAAQYERAGVEINYVQTGADSRTISLMMVNIVVYMLLAMVVLLAVVGGLGLAATMGLNVLERTREIGVLRAIGATNWSMWSIIVFEGVVIGLFSWGVGALLSVPIGRLLSGGVGMAFFGVWLDYIFSYAGLAFWLVVVVIVSALASLAPARRASHISVREALAYE